MKKVLITGANSYIGTSFEKYICERFADDYVVDTMDMLENGWRERSFVGYDVVFHVAGIAHMKETKENAKLYYEVNRDLSVEVARAAKADGVKQFVFLSTMSVYGQTTGVITKQTLPAPNTHYGRSKAQAEESILELADEQYAVAVVRPPMVYGNGCKGNFQSVLKLAERFPVFPRIRNQRSMIYIDNLCAFVKLCMDRNLTGVYLPQNEQYVRTDRLAALIAEAKGKKLLLSYICGVAVWLLRPFIGMLQKAFGTLVYKDTEEFNFEYCVVNFESSVKQSV